jgi:hypothetical protein
MIRASNYGTMGSQSASAVAITGGILNGTSIGATTPSTVNATTFSVGGVAGADGAVVIPGATTLTFSKGLVTSIV